MISPTRSRPDRKHTRGLMRDIVEGGGALQLHGACGRDVLRRSVLAVLGCPLLKTVPELRCFLEWSVLEATLVCAGLQIFAVSPTRP